MGNRVGCYNRSCPLPRTPILVAEFMRTQATSKQEVPSRWPLFHRDLEDFSALGNMGQSLPTSPRRAATCCRAAPDTKALTVTHHATPQLLPDMEKPDISRAMDRSGEELLIIFSLLFNNT